MNSDGKPICRFCGAPLRQTFVDLGATPLANSYVAAADRGRAEPVYPLHARVCGECLLVQVDDVVPATEIFSQYAYFSSYSATWLEHARRFAAQAIDEYGLTAASRVVEIASNDGYLLRNFVAAGVGCLGVEPARNVADAAIKAGIPTEVAFFGRATAERLRARGDAADLLVANNVLAHVPDLNDFVAGLGVLLKPGGVITVEVPHLLNLIRENQFDTIYHEHFSYFSLVTLEKVFAAHRLSIFDVAELPTHGGSLRLFVGHEGARPATAANLERVRAKEEAAGLHSLAGYSGFAAKVRETCAAFTAFLGRERAADKTFAAYGAAAKGNTLLNVCKVTGATIAFVADRSPAKQGTWLPGSRIPVFPPEKVFAAKPDYLLILPWNIAAEVCEQMEGIRAWGGKFVTAVPGLRVF